MSELLKYEAYKKKLQGVCDENNLVFRFRPDLYPVTLTIRPTGGIEGQISMLESVEENGYTSPEASIMFFYKDGVLTYKMSETFTLSDTLLSKIKNLYKNMHLLWMQHFFRDVMDKISKGALTVPDLPSVNGEPDDDPLDEDDLLDDMEPLEVDAEDDEDIDGSDDDLAEGDEDDGSDDAPPEDDYPYEEGEPNDDEA